MKLRKLKLEKLKQLSIAFLFLISYFNFHIFLWACVDSNHGPLHYQCSALTT